jgi:hypothetical protein
MFDGVFYSALSVVNLAFAMLSAAPLLALKQFPASSLRIPQVEDQGHTSNPGQQPSRVHGG